MSVVQIHLSPPPLPTKAAKEIFLAAFFIGESTSYSAGNALEVDTKTLTLRPFQDQTAAPPAWI